MNYREIVDQSGLRHVFIAKYIGCSKAMLSLFLKGERNLAPEKKIRLHTLLKIN